MGTRDPSPCPLKKLTTTGSVTAAVAAGTTAATTALGTMNNTVNAVYYIFISDGQSEIEDDPKKSTYVDRYVTRWERLDYTKAMTGEGAYNLNAWRFHSEYSLHMYGWYATEWARNKNVPIISTLAKKCEKAEVSSHSWDPRPTFAIATAIWGVLGI